LNIGSSLWAKPARSFYDLFAIDERFVHLNHSALTDHRSEITRAHRFVDIASQEPGRLIGHL
jgi:hypothetical protein